MTEHTPCRFPVNLSVEEHGAPCDPLCMTYHIGQKCKGPVRRTPEAPVQTPGCAAVAPDDRRECIRTEGKDEDTS